MLYNSYSETIEHLFFRCDFSVYIWTLCKLKLGLSPVINSLLEEVTLFKTIYAHKKLSALGKLVLVVAIWHIWKEQNCGNFELVSHSKSEVFAKIMEDVNILIKACSWKLDGDAHEQQVFSYWSLSDD